MSPLRRFLAALLLPAACGLAVADDGHDHGGGASAAAVAAQPRFAAVSEQFELVGVLDGRALTLWLDRFADNQPVPDARIELALGDTTLPLHAQGEGVYRATLAQAPAPGLIPVTATVTAGGQTDLLAGDLDVHAAEEHADTHAHSRLEWAGWGAGILLLATGLVWLARRRTMGGAA